YYNPGSGTRRSRHAEIARDGLGAAYYRIGQTGIGDLCRDAIVDGIFRRRFGRTFEYCAIENLAFRKRIGKKVPHMGWNSILPKKDCPLFKGISEDSYFYFVHSYFIEADEQYTSAFCTYDVVFSAALQKDNFYGVQFHPE